MNHELGSTLGAVRAHGSRGAFVSKWIVDKEHDDGAVRQRSDEERLPLGRSDTRSRSSAPATFAFQRFCSGDLPAVTAFYNPATGLGTQERLYMHGEEGGPGNQVATVVTGPSAGNAYVLGKFNFD